MENYFTISWVCFWWENKSKRQRDKAFHSLTVLMTRKMLINVRNSFYHMVHVVMMSCRYVIILTIISNCVVMSMDEHLPFGDKTVLAKQLVTFAHLISINI